MDWRWHTSNVVSHEKQSAYSWTNRQNLSQEQTLCSSTIWLTQSLHVWTCTPFVRTLIYLLELWYTDRCQRETNCWFQNTKEEESLCGLLIDFSPVAPHTPDDFAAVFRHTSNSPMKHNALYRDVPNPDLHPATEHKAPAQSSELQSAMLPEPWRGKTRGLG